MHSSQPVIDVTAFIERDDVHKCRRCFAFGYVSETLGLMNVAMSWIIDAWRSNLVTLSDLNWLDGGCCKRGAVEANLASSLSVALARCARRKRHEMERREIFISEPVAKVEVLGGDINEVHASDVYALINCLLSLVDGRPAEGEMIAAADDEVESLPSTELRQGIQ
jgi:hypothetical protein